MIPISGYLSSYVHIVVATHPFASPLLFSLRGQPESNLLLSPSVISTNSGIIRMKTACVDYNERKPRVRRHQPCSGKGALI